MGIIKIHDDLWQEEIGALFITGFFSRIFIQAILSES
ncbi:uncharacterized protein METZ01_LOCUS258857, partial [marine metagenome]